MPHLELSFANGIEEDVLKEIAEDLRAGGAEVALNRRPPERPYASLEWLIPTALVLWMVKPYLEEFSKETAKLHADGFHKGLSKLWSKVFGPKPEITYTIVAARGKLGPQVFSLAFSVTMPRIDGGRVTLLFPSATSLEDFSLAVERFTELMGKHYALNGADPLTRTMTLVSNHPNWPALVYMNPETKLLELIDYVRSSQTHKLTAFPIDSLENGK